MLVVSDVLPLADANTTFSEMVARVEQQHARIPISLHMQPAAVLS